MNYYIMKTVMFPCLLLILQKINLTAYKWMLCEEKLSSCSLINRGIYKDSILYVKDSRVGDPHRFKKLWCLSKILTLEEKKFKYFCRKFRDLSEP